VNAINKLAWLLFTLPFILMFMVIAPAWSGYNNVNITGNLVTEPCTLDPASAGIKLDFGNVVSKYFYANSRTPGEEFQVSLIDCDLSISKTVMLKFLGTESVVTGLLAPDDGDTHGIAIGVENADGTLQLPLNVETPIYDLSDGHTLLNFRGYIAGEPDAVKNKTITMGPFSATATIELIYP
jgi:type 1 fimbria pilin